MTSRSDHTRTWRKLFAPNALCLLALLLLAIAQIAVLVVEFWPWHAGLTEFAMMLMVGVGVAAGYAVVAVALFAAWVQRRELQNRRWLKSATWLALLLPLANVVYLVWWPTGEHLVQAARAGQVDVVKRCLFWGIEPDATYVKAAGFGGRSPSATPLVEAATHGHLEIVELLLEAGADIEGNSNAALSAAMYNAGPTVVRYLLQHGAKADQFVPEIVSPSFGGQPAQRQAARVLLELHPETVQTPWLLLAGADHGHPDVARLLASVNVQERFGPLYELHRAVVGGERGKTQQLFAQVEAKLPQPATEDDRLAALRFFAGYERHRDAALQQVTRETLLGVAARFGATDFITTLLNAATPVDPPVDAHRSLRAPLHRAIWNDHPETVAVLLNAGADVMRINRDLGTPLNAAVAQSSPVIVTLLLDAGADINAPRSDISADTAIMNAIRMDDLEMVMLLIERGADLSRRDERGMTPCFQARRQPEVAEFMATQDCGV